jgi:hypothetical protein
MTYDPRAPAPRSRMSGPTMAAIAIAAMIGLGALFYAVGGGDRTNMSSSSPSATSVGQGQSGEPTAFPKTGPAPVPQSK